MSVAHWNFPVQLPAFASLRVYAENWTGAAWVKHVPLVADAYYEGASQAAQW